ncbi:putative beta-1,6-glucanase Neg1 [Exophiala viscosa]|uniref:Beta-1,6-glucanase Neg1 n=1 Tax=Exophiala viscosa TaxID=2486360 RepID=A0AAN6DRE7_9EURO|nr:putative beta-1,6-glucanase Neg1 [Exophiala viscosa]
MSRSIVFALYYTSVVAQSVQHLGVSCIGSTQQCGPRGGIGDGAHPVLTAQSFITDALLSTTPNSTRQLASGPPPVLIQALPSSTSSCTPRRDIIIDTANGAQQEMVGFGHAWTDSTVSVFNTLDNATLAQVLEDLFGQSGNNMGFMRHTIGSSDLSGEQYTYDDNGPSFNEGEPDLDLSHFSIEPYGSAMAGMIAKMGAVKGDVFLFGSPWSYPGWTKFNDLFIAPNLNVPNGGSYNILNNSFNPAFILQMVTYFSKYIDAFRSHGVQVNGLTPMNEPLNYQGGYPCMYLSDVDAANLIAQGLGQAMHDRGVIIMAYDHNTDQPVYPARVVLGTGGEGALTDAAAWHCYASPVANYSVMSDFKTMFPNTLQFMTECSNYLPQSGTWNFEVASNFIPPVTHGASGAAMWVTATDESYGPHSPYGGCAGCLGSIVVNSSNTYTRTNDYYMVGQFSRFVRRGAVNYQVLGEGNEGDARGANQFYTMAVQNPDGSFAVVMMNNWGSDQDVVLEIGQGHWQGTVPNGTVTTWLIPAEALWWDQGQNATGTYNSTQGGAGGSVSTSAVCATTASSSSQSTTSTTALEPVLDTTHTIASVITTVMGRRKHVA